jgi:hypothetical protein
MPEPNNQFTEQLILTASRIRDIISSKGKQNTLMEMLGEKPNPFKGMCYVASALLYGLYDGKNMTLYRKKDYSGQYHWWIKTDDGTTIDMTREQYEIEGKEVPSASYDGAEIAKPMWFPSYKKRIAALKTELEAFQLGR